MSIATKLAELTQIRTDIRTALAGKGISSSTHDFADFATDIGNIPSGGGGLPATYQQVDYIETTGTQWINTNMLQVEWDQFVGDFEMTDNTYWNCLFGSSKSEADGTAISNKMLLMSDNDQNKKLRLAYSGYWTVTGEAALSVNTKYTIQVLAMMLNTQKILVDGSSKLTTSHGQGSGSNTDTNPYPVALFTTTKGGVAIQNTTGGNVKYPFCGKFYGGTFYLNFAKVREFVPCYRIADGVIGLYDLVGEQFYTNAGTGTFI